MENVEIQVDEAESLSATPEYSKIVREEGLAETEDAGEGKTSTGTQTTSSMFMGRQGETVITSNLDQVKVVVNEDLIHVMTDSSREAMLQNRETPVVRLDWNRGPIMENAMSSFQLQLSKRMPQLYTRLCEILAPEGSHRRLLKSVEVMFERHKTKLFGINVAEGPTFILEHPSVEDAEMTLRSEERQKELERILLTFLPELDESSAEWTVTSYTMSAEDRAANFGMKNAREIPLVDSLQLWKDSGGPPGWESTPREESSLRKTSKHPSSNTCKGESAPSMAGESALDPAFLSDLGIRDHVAEASSLSAGGSHLRDPHHPREQPSSPAGDSVARAEVGERRRGSGPRLEDPTSPAVTQEDAQEGKRTTQIQTPVPVSLGKLGKTIITPHFTLARVVINDNQVQRLTGSRPEDMQQNPDILERALVRLDWNREQVMERKTSFQLSLTNGLMPQLLAQLSHILASEPEHHKVQQLAQILLEKYNITLHGINMGGLTFILEHPSVEDAEMTLRSEERQKELERILLTFLPGWVASSATWTVTSYTMSPEDRAANFGMKNAREIPVVNSLQLWKDSGGPPCWESTPQEESNLRKTSKDPNSKTCEGESAPSMAGESALDPAFLSDLGVRDHVAEASSLSAGDSHLRDPHHPREQPSSPAGDSAARAEVGERGRGSGPRLEDPTSPAVTQEKWTACDLAAQDSYSVMATLMMRHSTDVKEQMKTGPITLYCADFRGL